MTRDKRRRRVGAKGKIHVAESWLMGKKGSVNLGMCFAAFVKCFQCEFAQNHLVATDDLYIS